MNRYGVMKKLGSLLLCLVMVCLVFSLAGCGAKKGKRSKSNVHPVMNAESKSTSRSVNVGVFADF